MHFYPEYALSEFYAAQGGKITIMAGAALGCADIYSITISLQ